MREVQITIVITKLLFKEGNMFYWTDFEEKTLFYLRAELS